MMHIVDDHAVVLEVMTRVHGLYPDMRFVIMSGEDWTVHQSKLGACIYLAKPIRPETLEQAIEHLRYCDSCGPSQELANAYTDDRYRFGLSAADCPLAPSAAV